MERFEVVTVIVVPAAGSAVAQCAPEFTNVDPIKYDFTYLSVSRSRAVFQMPDS